MNTVSGERDSVLSLHLSTQVQLADCEYLLRKEGYCVITPSTSTHSIVPLADCEYLLRKEGHCVFAPSTLHLLSLSNSLYF